MKTYKLRNTILVQKNGNKTVLFDGDKSILITLNETATVIFSLIKRGENTVEIKKKLSNKYNIPLLEAEKDLQMIIIKLLKQNIIIPL